MSDEKKIDFVFFLKEFTVVSQKTKILKKQ